MFDWGRVMYLVIEVWRAGKPARSILLEDPRELICRQLRDEGHDVRFTRFDVQSSWPVRDDVQRKPE